MNKADFVKRIAADTELTQKQAAAALDSVLANIQEVVASGDTLAFTGFGSFSVKSREAREGRNPATGEAMSIPASKVPAFKAGKAFKDKVNG